MNEEFTVNLCDPVEEGEKIIVYTWYDRDPPYKTKNTYKKYSKEIDPKYHDIKREVNGSYDVFNIGVYRVVKVIDKKVVVA